MEKEKIIINTLAILAVSFIIIIAVVLSQGKKPPVTEKITANVPSASSSSMFEPKTTGSASTQDAEIVLQPHKVSEGKLVVDINVNTHGVNLNEFDLREITQLTYKTKTIKPISAPQLRGHHNSGELVFEVDQDIESFTITISGIPAVEQRTFTWN